MTTKHVYLAGPITGLTFEEAQDGWRTHAAQVLGDVGIPTRTPLRGKDFLRSHGVLRDDYLDLHQYASPNGILRRDFNDVKDAGVVLACFLDAPKVSIGTCWEIGAAYALQVPVISVLEKGSAHDHVFVTNSSVYVFDNLDAALDGVLYIMGAV